MTKTYQRIRPSLGIKGISQTLDEIEKFLVEAKKENLRVINDSNKSAVTRCRANLMAIKHLASEGRDELTKQKTAA